MADVDERWTTLLENPEEGGERLQKVLNESAAKFERLEGKWKAMRDEKMGKLQELKEKYSSALEIENLREKAQTVRGKRKALIEEMQGKEQYIEKLKRRLEKLESDDCNRGMFTKRITEIVNNIRKQREEMDKVNKDILSLHKEIRWLSQAVQRTFGVIEEQLYREANQSYKGERSYKLFSKIHACCQKAMHCIERSGQLAKNVEELTDHAEIGRQSTVDTRLYQVLTDLEAVEAEKERFKEKIKENDANGFKCDCERTFFSYTELLYYRHPDEEQIYGFA
ncbi:unnamed protein product, partial [Mesorhabditis belari]|uniref:Coiled-coil domain-containing protein 22 homolog n=1 Tax=Mesorhabditis belari TaxID=2138241 RepID=A0AAF3FJQ1_9BILA